MNFLVNFLVNEDVTLIFDPNVHSVLQNSFLVDAIIHFVCCLYSSEISEKLMIRPHWSIIKAPIFLSKWVFWIYAFNTVSLRTSWLFLIIFHCRLDAFLLRKECYLPWPRTFQKVYFPLYSGPSCKRMYPWNTTPLSLISLPILRTWEIEVL